MKEIVDVEKVKLQKVRIDKSLSKYDDIVLFPNQVKKAKEMFEKAGGISTLSEAIRKHQCK